MLLNDDDDQKHIYNLVNELIEIINKKESFKDKYDPKEKELVQQARLLLRGKWHKISRFSKIEITIKILAVVSIIFWVGFLFLDVKLNGVMEQAVSSGTKTYDELYGVLSFWKPILYWTSLSFSIFLSSLCFFKSK